MKLQAISEDQFGAFRASSTNQIPDANVRPHGDVAIDEDDDTGDLFPKRVSRTDLIRCTTQLSVMIDTGINLSVALRGIAETEENSTLRSVLFDIQKGVEGGDDFSACLEKHSKHFSETYTALVRSSEQTGRLSEILEQIAEYMQNELENRNKVRGALAYPCIMMTFSFGITLFLLTFILPKFAPIFSGRGMELPVSTQVMMALSEAMIEYWIAWIAGTVFLLAGFLYWRKTSSGRQVIDWLKINTPILGPLFKKVAISRSVRTLGTMIECGVSVLEALHYSAAVSGNHFYEKAWTQAIESVTSGDQICDAIRNNPLFPSTLVQMIRSGEETGRLDYVLKKVSLHYDRQVESNLKTVTTLLEPLMIMVMGGIVGGIGMSILLPIFSLSRGG